MAQLAACGGSRFQPFQSFQRVPNVWDMQAVQIAVLFKVESDTEIQEFLESD
jgi:hypothetical protein